MDKGVVTKYEELKSKIPADFISLVDVKGLGPETLRRLHEELHINSQQELEKALDDGRVEQLDGFGPKKVENIRAGLRMKQAAEERILLWHALELGDMLVREIKKLPGVQKVETAGSLRRRKETVGDIDLLVTAKKADWPKILQAFVELPEVEKVLVRGETKSSVVVEKYHRQVDVRMIEADAWGAALMYFTGSKAHSVRLRQIALDHQLKLNEYGVFTLKEEKKIAGKTEEEVYKALGLAWMPPEMRENRGELEPAAQGKIPELVSLKDIKGDMHMHSTYSDGKHTLEEIAYFIKANYAYEYIVITDHSKSTRVAGGMDEQGFQKQIEAIKKINEQLGEDFLKTGAEVDILTDGRMDLSDELLSQLDWVIGSIHAQFTKDNTDRIISACHNPYVCAIGHPTGRLINSREGYPLQMEEVIKAAEETGTALEINAQPSRMDLNDHWVRVAREHQVPLVINTDSHTFSHYAYLRLGVYNARRAWCRPKDILNTKGWKDILKFKQHKQQLVH